MAFGILRQAHSTELARAADLRRAVRRSTDEDCIPAVNDCSLQVLDEARFLDGFLVGAPAKDGGLFKPSRLRSPSPGPPSKLPTRRRQRFCSASCRLRPNPVSSRASSHLLVAVLTAVSFPSSAEVERHWQ